MSGFKRGLIQRLPFMVIGLVFSVVWAYFVSRWYA